ncbi:hypothetical protein HanXRQr2_Chr08g0357081 [Helianthus annuus]|uniref:Uncharacterized protein n=1 Tax=Helianthus annuus TaxID=4232 RepID=A0A9K3IH71_HELAN|nr:hypothetical protein HanXRQr2_Chr08g0357081 [Helianthus annuus]KAJ0903070.1 hypothetical protein HanPSC8_Chr08g0344771 [Helianthus annuus]
MRAFYHKNHHQNPIYILERYLSSASGIMAYLVVVDACFVT